MDKFDKDIHIVEQFVNIILLRTVTDSKLLLYIFPWQLKAVLQRSIDAWVGLFDSHTLQNHLPLFLMNLAYEEEAMQFYPSFEDLEHTITFVVERLSSTLQLVMILLKEIKYLKYLSLFI